jgi:predicted deacetylase
VALGVDVLNGMDRPQAEQLISRTRLYVAPRLLLAAQANCALDEAGFRALGFTLVETDAAAGVRVYAYDLDTYKSTPDWLNARFWAHPERWEP